MVWHSSVVYLSVNLYRCHSINWHCDIVMFFVIVITLKCWCFLNNLGPPDFKNAKAERIIVIVVICDWMEACAWICHCHCRHLPKPFVEWFHGHWPLLSLSVDNLIYQHHSFLVFNIPYKSWLLWADRDSSLLAYVHHYCRCHLTSICAAATSNSDIDWTAFIS